MPEDITRDVRETAVEDLPTQDGSEEVGRDLVEDVDSGDAPLPPVADPGGNITGRAGAPITFDGSESHDPDGEIEAWRWSFGDGSTLDGEVVHYTYTAAGAFIVTLTVTDDSGLTDEAQIEADIEPANEGPTAVIEGPSEVVAPEEAEFDANNSSDDGSIVSFSWDVGVDGVDPVDGAELAYT